MGRYLAKHRNRKRQHERRSKYRRAHMHAYLRRSKERRAKRYLSRHKGRYTGRSWCETFYTCKGGDKRNFHAWVKAKGWKQFKGACTHKKNSKKYGRRHKFWRGNYTFKACRAKCIKMGPKCQGITMKSNVKRARGGKRRKCNRRCRARRHAAWKKRRAKRIA